MKIDRAKPADLKAEPTYQGLEKELVVFSIAHPDWTAHSKNESCETEEPHKITNCGMWTDE